MWKILVGLVSIAILGREAAALVLAPGNSFAFLPLLADGTDLGTPITSATTPVADLSPENPLLLDSAVYGDPSGNLTFTYLLRSGMSPNSVFFIAGFAGVTIDAFYEVNGATLLVPGNMGRSADGDSINFGFALGNAGKSALYVLRTDATLYDDVGNPLFVFGSDIGGDPSRLASGSGTLVPVPEPGTALSVCALGMIGLIPRRRRGG